MSSHVPLSQAPVESQHDRVISGEAPRLAMEADRGPRQALRQQALRGARRAGAVVAPVAAALVVLLALWQWYAGGLGSNALVLPTPAAIWTTLILQRAALWANTLVTLEETAIGFGAALATGVAFGVLIDTLPWLRRALYPLLVTSQTIPLIALAPLLVLWFGPGLLSKVLVVVLVCFFPITVALADGLRAVDPELVNLFRAFGAGPVRIFWSARLPGALPALFSGIRIAIAYSIIGAIFSEYVGADAGLGFYIQLELHSFATAAVLATVVVAAALSIALFGLVAAVERLALPWYFAERHHGGA